MDENKPLYFSIFGGYIYESDKDEEKILDAFQIPLVSRPKSTCKCKGRFHVGFDTKTKHFIVCSKCARKCIDAQKMVARKYDKKTK